MSHFHFMYLSVQTKCCQFRDFLIQFPPFEIEVDFEVLGSENKPYRKWLESVQFYGHPPFDEYETIGWNGTIF